MADYSCPEGQCVHGFDRKEVKVSKFGAVGVQPSQALVDQLKTVLGRLEAEVESRENELDLYKLQVLSTASMIEELESELQAE